MKNFKSILCCVVIICSPILAETNTKIFQEARAGNVQAIKNRINNSEDLSQKDEDGNTILHVAAEQGQRALNRLRPGAPGTR